VFFGSKSGRQLGIVLKERRILAVLCKYKGNNYDFENFSIELESGCVKNGLLVDVQTVIEIFCKKIKLQNWQGLDAITTIVSPQVVVRHLDFPIMQAAELHETIKWEITQHIPYAREDAVYDWCNLGSIKKDRPNVNTILLAAAHRAVVESYVQFFEQTGLVLQGIDIVAAALNRWFLCVGLKKWQDLDILAVGIIDFGEDTTNFLITKDGVIEFCRLLAFGNRQKTNIDEENTFIEELYRSVEYYQNNYKTKIAGLIITGEPSKRVQAVADTLKIPITPRDIRDTNFNNFELEYAVATGLALKGVETWQR
jgi:type IV pilus assembly protein PilM